MSVILNLILYSTIEFLRPQKFYCLYYSHCSVNEYYLKSDFHFGSNCLAPLKFEKSASSFTKFVKSCFKFILHICLHIKKVVILNFNVN